jgi:NAD(P)-dependent dehydrogenase (short-subunit alcohol dehydrogenase family)
MALTGKTVVVTGAATGIGRYVARTLANAGGNVVVADIRPLDTVLGELQQTGRESHGVITDVTDEPSVRRLFDAAFERFGRIDVLVNNAGIVPHFSVGSPRWSRVRDFPREFFSKVIDTNLGGTFLCCKHAIPYMESLNSGHIVNFGQGNLKPSERRPNIGSCVYETSKLAIRAFSKALAEEEREFNICVVSMGPGSGRPPSLGPGVTGGGGGIVTEDSPAWTRAAGAVANSVDTIGDNYVLAAEADMSFSGRQVTVRDGALVVMDD